jgi:hypothetical protein
MHANLVQETFSKQLNNLWICVSIFAKYPFLPAPNASLAFA